MARGARESQTDRLEFPKITKLEKKKGLYIIKMRCYELVDIASGGTAQALQ
jgi:hypothetical protein